MMQVFLAIAIPLAAGGAVGFGIACAGINPVPQGPMLLATAVAAALVCLNVLMKLLPKHKWDWLIHSLGYLYVGLVFLMYAPSGPVTVPAVLVGLAAGVAHWTIVTLKV